MTDNLEKIIAFIAEFDGLDKCTFSDECDQCDNPEYGSYAKLYHEPEGVTETEFYICGKCLSQDIPGWIFSRISDEADNYSFESDGEEMWHNKETRAAFIAGAAYVSDKLKDLFTLQ